LCDDQPMPFVLWATVKIPVLENPGNVANAMLNCLANFIKAAGKEDTYFMIFPYHLSKYSQVSNLPQAIVNIDSLPKEVDDWLQYFSQAKTRAKGGKSTLLLSWV